MYRSLHPEMFTRGQFVRAAAFSLGRNASIPEDLLFNVFEKVARTVFPGLADDFTVLEDIAGARAHLAGSGPCLYALVQSEDGAHRTVTRLQASGRHACAAHTCEAVCL
jgi:4-diphosphocytidyl-2C-methyl-D-erythritol kinase